MRCEEFVRELFHSRVPNVAKRFLFLCCSVLPNLKPELYIPQEVRLTKLGSIHFSSSFEGYKRYSADIPTDTPKDSTPFKQQPCSQWPSWKVRNPLPFKICVKHPREKACSCVARPIYFIYFVPMRFKRLRVSSNAKKRVTFCKKVDTGRPYPSHKRIIG